MITETYFVQLLLLYSSDFAREVRENLNQDLNDLPN